MLSVQGGLILSLEGSLQETRKKEEASCGHRRQVQQQKVKKLPQEQIRGRQEAAGDRGQTELSQEQITRPTQTQGRAAPVRWAHSRGGGQGGADPGLATRPELPVCQPRRGAGHVQSQQIRDPDPGFWSGVCGPVSFVIAVFRDTAPDFLHLLWPIPRVRAH